MKQVKILLASVCVAILAVSCMKNAEEMAPVKENAQLTTITCAFPTMTDQFGTKVSLDAAGKTGWEAGDKIAIYGARNSTPGDASTHIDPIIHTLTAAEVTDPTVATFAVDLSGLIEDPAGKYPFNAAYPADDWAFYSDWYSSARARFYETNQILLAGWLDGTTMTLLNLCSVIMFKVEGDFDQYQFFGNNDETVGYDDYLVEVNSDSPSYLKKPGADYGTNGPKTKLVATVNGDGTTMNYIFIPNEVNLSGGFTIQFLKDGDIVKYVKSQAPLALVHGQGVNLGKLPDSAIHDYVPPTPPSSHDATHPAITGATDLGASGTANCYIVYSNDEGNKDKVFKFKAVKGNSDEIVSGIASAVVLWETYNSADVVTAKTVIFDVDFDKQDGDDNYWITFQMPSTLHAGNALIAAKDNSGNILWSWHIWVPKTTLSSSQYGLGGQTLMDRNLGALEVAVASAVTPESQGMLYSWGRKDPFLANAVIGSEDPYTVAEGQASISIGTSGALMTVAESIKNPTTFVRTGGDDVKDWCSETEVSPTLWGDTKTKYDPCPAGYQVPYNPWDSEKNGIWNLKADDAVIATLHFSKNVEEHWFQMGDPATVFPICGYLDQSGYKNCGSRAYYWSSRSTGTGVANVIRVDSSNNRVTDERKSRAGNIRCSVIPAAE